MSLNMSPDQLPLLDDPYELTQEQIAYYQTKGHIFLKNVAKAGELDVYRPIIEELVFAHNYHTKPVGERDTYGKAFIQVGNLWQKSEATRRFLLARRFAKIAADLMGVSGVRMYHDQALFKEPGGGHTPWHQDQIYWPLDTDKTITLWMPLVPIPEEVGTMSFASETQKLGYVNKQVISDESHSTLQQLIQARGYEVVSYGAMAPGDATFHSGWTIHSAPANPTDKMREVMTIIYVADNTRIAEPDSKARQSDLNSWFPGLKPGDIAASPLNPLLYSRTEEAGK